MFRSIVGELGLICMAVRSFSFGRSRKSAHVTDSFDNLFSEGLNNLLFAAKESKDLLSRVPVFASAGKTSASFSISSSKCVFSEEFKKRMIEMRPTMTDKRSLLKGKFL